MNTDRHRFFEGPRNTLNYMEGLNDLFPCPPCFPWLKTTRPSAISIHNSALGEAAWLKEIQ